MEYPFVLCEEDSLAQMTHGFGYEAEVGEGTVQGSGDRLVVLAVVQDCEPER